MHIFGTETAFRILLTHACILKEDWPFTVDIKLQEIMVNIWQLKKSGRYFAHSSIWRQSYLWRRIAVPILLGSMMSDDQAGKCSRRMWVYKFVVFKRHMEIQVWVNKRYSISPLYTPIFLSAHDFNKAVFQVSHIEIQIKVCARAHILYEVLNHFKEFCRDDDFIC